MRAHEPLAAADAASRQWSLRRNCALTPRQVLGGLGVAALLPLAVGLAGWALGYPVVAAFAALEVAALAVALVCHARHARDGEWLRLEPECLRIEQRCGPCVAVTTLPADWLQVACAPGPQALVRLSAGGRSVQIGAHVPALLRPRLAAELRSALQAARAR
jgi:uncharacterized membrane protein